MFSHKVTNGALHRLWKQRDFCFQRFFFCNKSECRHYCFNILPPFISKLFQWREAVHQEPGIEVQIANYFKQSAPQQLSQEELLRTLTDNIARSKETLKEKAIISGLLEKLETESDTIKLQVYRQALEVLLRRDLR